MTAKAGIQIFTRDNAWRASPAIGARGKRVGRRRKTVQMLPHPSCWNEQYWRLARAVLEPETHRLPPKGLSLSSGVIQARKLTTDPHIAAVTDFLHFFARQCLYVFSQLIVDMLDRFRRT
jgi:hypothetical protein